MADRWRSVLGRADDVFAPGQGYRDLLSCFGILESGIPLTYRDEHIIKDSVRERGEEIAWIHSPVLFIWFTINPNTQLST